MGALLWLAAGLFLAGLELFVGEFTLLTLAGAAFVTTGVALFDVPLWAEILTFVISSVALLLFARPYLQKRLLKPGALDTSPDALVGSAAEVIESVNEDGGQVRLDGSLWSARSLDPAVKFNEGEIVHVANIDGPVAVVWKD